MSLEHENGEADQRAARLLTLESHRDEWEAKAPRWRVWLAAFVALLVGSAAAPFAQGLLLGLLVVVVLTAPVTLFVRQLRLAEIDRQIDELRLELIESETGL